MYMLIYQHAENNKHASRNAASLYQPTASAAIESVMATCGMTLPT
jgi:hypothetical protein